jgi:DNA ligase 1
MIRNVNALSVVNRVIKSFILILWYPSDSGYIFRHKELASFTEKKRPLVIETKKCPINYNIGDALDPDHWFTWSVVWELQAADLSKSSVHKGGMGKLEAGRGVALRFPRFIRERHDKMSEHATSAEQIVEMYNSQGEVGAVNDSEDDDDELI